MPSPQSSITKPLPRVWRRNRGVVSPDRSTITSPSRSRRKRRAPSRLLLLTRAPWMSAASFFPSLVAAYAARSTLASPLRRSIPARVTPFRPRPRSLFHFRSFADEVVFRFESDDAVRFLFHPIGAEHKLHVPPLVPVHEVAPGWSLVVCRTADVPASKSLPRTLKGKALPELESNGSDGMDLYSFSEALWRLSVRSLSVLVTYRSISLALFLRKGRAAPRALLAFATPTCASARSTTTSQSHMHPSVSFSAACPSFPGQCRRCSSSKALWFCVGCRAVGGDHPGVECCRDSPSPGSCRQSDCRQEPGDGGHQLSRGLTCPTWANQDSSLGPAIAGC